MDNISWTLFTEVYGVYGYTPFNWCVYPTCYLDLLHPFFGEGSEGMDLGR